MYGTHFVRRELAAANMPLEPPGGADVSRGGAVTVNAARG
jgi:hypothetical protein